MLFKSNGPALLPPPDDLTIPQFMLDSFHPARPVREDHSPWLIDDQSGKSYHYEQIRMRVHGLANGLTSRWHLKNDDVVCIYSPNNIEYPIAIWACHRIGAIVSGANPSYTVDELVYQLKTSRATILITHPVSLPVAREAARITGLSPSNIILLEPTSSGRQEFAFIEELATEGLTFPKSLYVEPRLRSGEGKTKIAFLSFSSGTTGSPKAVAIPHYAPISNVLQMATYQEVNQYQKPREKRRFRPGDVCIAVLPFYHIYGLVVNLHWMIFSGLSIVVVPKFNFIEMLKSIERHKITHLMLVPPQIVLLCKQPETRKYDLSRLRYCMVGAAPLSAELSLQFEKLLPNVVLAQGYGMTETSTTVTMLPSTEPRGIAGCAGRLISGTEAKVLKPDGSLAGYDEEGELMVKGPQNALRYQNNEKATKETFIDGWVRTGDEVLIKENGNVYIVDRLKEIFKVRGFQVAPAELEGHLLEHPDVADCAVIGVPDEYSGDVPLAFVTLTGDAAKRVKENPAEGDRIKASIKKHVSDVKVKYKWLEGGVEFIDAIPKNPSGKLLRRLLRDQAKAIIAKRAQASKAKL
ncbi:phenylacetyl-CoA ligase [Sistotremastrum niveocremeum HHB9708]|uniref:Phenylacetyl-CoA ligase n=1 Tax=Sistotremastrum niveocremeum HHB9708 TaxID=1314777 RepID=A0A165A2D7_9AGAM|nr:phenylacetyl-CoA ligase [Sistotremastrum niveocremeum HHB9708]